MNLVQKRPVRFAFLVEAFLGLVVFLLGVDPEIIIKSMLVVNAGLAFYVDGYTTPVNKRTGEPLNSKYSLQ